MNWESLTLGELCRKYNGKIQTGPFGSQLHQSDYKEHGTPVVMPKDIVNDKISLDGIARIEDKDVERLSKHILKVGDIVFPRRGEINKRALIRAENEGLLCGTGCLKISVNSEQVSNLFLNYYLARKESVDWLENNAVGSTMKNISGEILSKVPIELPQPGIQKKIASILSAYDDLIENNLKRIRLLEEAAQHLYREWFVKFRFPATADKPGWEEVKVVDGLPEGWERKAIGEVCETVGGGTPSTKEPRFWDSGEIVWFSPTDLSKNSSLVLLDSTSKITEAGLKNSSAKMLPPRTILMSSRATIGLFGIISKPCSTNQGFISIIPKEEYFRYYLLFNLLNRKQEIINNANGSTFKEISKKHFREMEIVMPNSDLAKQFHYLSESFLNQIENLERQNQKLKSARDILLPRLMNQTIEV